ncbi:MAG TPA: nitroreductase [Bacillota bacterium]|nr:nitroreductase [Clostridiales bacterium]HPT84613.1 nitroreductase [Bacillota bacterium]
MNETLRVISERYSCRDYLPEMPSEADLRAVAEAAVKSPSAVNRQPWHIIVVKNPKLIAEMEAEGMKRLAEMEDKTHYNRIMERGGRLFYGAPCMIVIACDARGGISHIDCGIVCQTIALAATSLGIANVICGLAGLIFSGPEGERYERLLGFPEGYKFGCAVLLGYAKTTKPPHEPDYTKISFVE